MNHDTLKELVFAWRAGELADDQSQRAQAHWAVCSECRTAWVEWVKLSGAVFSPAPRPDADAFVAAVMERVRQAPMPHHRSRSLWALAAAAVFLLGVGAWFRLHQRPVSPAAQAFASELMPASYLEADADEDAAIQTNIETYFL
jgi:anti-sigma factor RsiW